MNSWSMEWWKKTTMFFKLSLHRPLSDLTLFSLLKETISHPHEFLKKMRANQRKRKATRRNWSQREARMFLLPHRHLWQQREEFSFRKGFIQVGQEWKRRRNGSHQGIFLSHCWSRCMSMIMRSLKYKRFHTSISRSESDISRSMKPIVTTMC